MVNLSLRNHNFFKKFSMSDAKDFMKMMDKDNDNKVSKEELYEFFRHVLGK